jgi:hypothetical protein
MTSGPSTSDRRKTSFNLTPRATKALARAKFELLARYDMQASQGDIIEVLLLKYAPDLESLRRLLQQREAVTQTT